MAISIVDGVEVAGGDLLADLIWETDPAFFSFIFGTLPVWRRLFPPEWTAAFGANQDDESRVALLGDRPVGLVNSFAGAEVTPRLAASMGRQLVALNQDAAQQLTAAYDAMEWLFPSVPDDALFIINLVVSAEMRGQNLGQRLLAEAVTKARRLGLHAVHLDVAADNPAVQFYHRMGFRAVVESRAMSLPVGIELPNHFRMVLDVTANSP